MSAPTLYHYTCDHEVLNFRFAHEEAQRFRTLLLHFMNVNREEH